MLYKKNNIYYKYSYSKGIVNECLNKILFVNYFYFN